MYKRCKLKILFVFYGSWLGFDWEDRKNKWRQLLFDTAEDTGIIDYVVFIEQKNREDIRLKAFIDYYKPDLIFIAEHGEERPSSVFILEELRNWTDRIPVYAFRADCTSQGDIENAERLTNYVSKIITIDRLESPKGVMNPDKYINLPGPYSNRIFHCVNAEREYDIVFWGEIR